MLQELLAHTREWLKSVYGDHKGNLAYYETIKRMNRNRRCENRAYRLSVIARIKARIQNRVLQKTVFTMPVDPFGRSVMIALSLSEER